MTLANTTIASNIVDGNGGGINNNAGTLTITDSTLSANQGYGSGSGGAIENSGGAVTVTNSTIDANIASGAGGGIDNESGGSLSLTSATLSANFSDNGNGGGIDNNGGMLSLQNTIVAANIDYTVNEDIVGVITTDNGNNLLGTGANNTTTNPTPGPNNVFSNTPMLGTLGDYGGPTQTMALLAGSPAIGAGNAGAALPSTDQRLAACRQWQPRHRCIPDAGSDSGLHDARPDRRRRPTDWRHHGRVGRPGRKPGPGGQRRHGGFNFQQFNWRQLLLSERVTDQRRPTYHSSG